MMERYQFNDQHTSFLKRVQNVLNTAILTKKEPQKRKSLPHPLVSIDSREKIAKPIKYPRRDILSFAGISFASPWMQFYVADSLQKIFNFQAGQKAEIELKTEEDENAPLAAQEILPFVLQNYVISSADYNQEGRLYMYHPLDNFPSNNLQQQGNFIDQSQKFWNVGTRITPSPLEYRRNALSLVSDQDLEVGQILCLKSETSFLGSHQFSEYFLIVEQDGKKILYRLLGQVKIPEPISVEKLTQLYSNIYITEVLIYNPAKLVELQMKLKKELPNTPLFNRQKDIDKPGSFRHYGNLHAWGAGQKADGDPRTPREYAQHILDRHIHYERVNQAGTSDLVVELIIFFAEGSYLSANKLMKDANGIEKLETEIVMEEIEKLVEELNETNGGNRQIRFALHLRPPADWTMRKQSGRPGDKLYQFIQDFYTKPNLFSAECLAKRRFDWSFDPELSGYNAKHSWGVRQMTTTEIANMAKMLEHYSPGSHLGFYDVGAYPTDIERKIEGDNYITKDGPLPSNVGLYYMGTLDLEPGVKYLTDEMIEKKRSYMLSLIKKLYADSGEYPEDICMMLTDVSLNPNYSTQINDGYITPEILAKLTKSFDMGNGQIVRVNIALQ